MEILIILGAALLGILVGSVLNVLADDLPMRRTPSQPHYPDGTLRAPSAWLGITAFLTGQREPPPGAEPRPAYASGPVEAASPMARKVGACRSAAAKPRPRRLSWRYPLVEIALGSLPRDGTGSATSLSFRCGWCTSRSCCWSP